MAPGLTELARTPTCNIQVLGASKENLAESSTATKLCVGHIGQTEMFQSAPLACLKAACQIANKSTLAARVHFVGGVST